MLSKNWLHQIEVKIYLKFVEVKFCSYFPSYSYPAKAELLLLNIWFIPQLQLLTLQD